MVHAWVHEKWKQGQWVHVTATPLLTDPGYSFVTNDLSILSSVVINNLESAIEIRCRFKSPGWAIQKGTTSWLGFLPLGPIGRNMLVSAPSVQLKLALTVYSCHTTNSQWTSCAEVDLYGIAWNSRDQGQNSNSLRDAIGRSHEKPTLPVPLSSTPNSKHPIPHLNRQIYPQYLHLSQTAKHLLKEKKIRHPTHVSGLKTVQGLQNNGDAKLSGTVWLAKGGGVYGVSFHFNTFFSNVWAQAAPRMATTSVPIPSKPPPPGGQWSSMAQVPSLRALQRTWTSALRYNSLAQSASSVAIRWNPIYMRTTEN